jgi:type I restriction enzyme, S subunit
VLKAACEGRLVPTEAELARREGCSYEPASQFLKRILAERRTRWEADQLAKFRAAGKEPKDDRWKAKYNEPAKPDTKNLPEMPNGWTWATLPLLGELNRGKSKHRPRNDPKLLGGSYPFVQTGDVKSSGGYIRNHSQTYTEFGLAQSRLWPAGTLCITIAANIAETGILTYPACFPDSVVGFLFESDQITVRFIDFFLRTAKDEISRFAPATAQKNINLEILSRVAVPLPPMAEQCRIVAEVECRFSVIDELETTVEANLKRAARLSQAILKYAFEGKLVPQDPDDEPAIALLERIRAERAEPRTVRKGWSFPHGNVREAATGSRKSKDAS